MCCVRCSLVVVGLLCAAASADDKVLSGPQPGEKITPLRVIQVKSPEDVKEVEIVGENGKEVTLLVFMHKLSESSIGLSITLESYAHKQKGLDSHFVMLTSDKAATEEKAKRWWRRPFFAKAPMCISVDGPEGPGKYGLNRNVDMTVLVAKNNKVVSSMAINGPNQTDAPKILAAIASAIGQPAPSFEKVRAELRAERQKRRDERLKENPIYKLAPNDSLGRLMLSMIFTEAGSAERARRIADEMTKSVGENKKKKAALVKYCKAVLEGDFALNRYAREELERLSKK